MSQHKCYELVYVLAYFQNTCQATMIVTKVFTISCLLSILATNPTQAKNFLIETKENVKKNDAKDYDDGGEENGDCKEVSCMPVLELSFQCFRVMILLESNLQF